MRGVDSSVKLTDYFRVPSISHCLIVRTKPRVVVHYRRTNEGVAITMLRDGAITLDPPGIAVEIAKFYAA